jgi:hypothetical protein
METILANIRHAIRNRDYVHIGGGHFGAEDLRPVADLIAAHLRDRTEVTRIHRMLWDRPINTAADARCHFIWLELAGLLYHPDDDATEVITGAWPNAVRCFTNEEAALLNQRMNEVRRFFPCPVEGMPDIFLGKSASSA